MKKTIVFAHFVILLGLGLSFKGQCQETDQLLERLSGISQYIGHSADVLTSNQKRDILRHLEIIENILLPSSQKQSISGSIAGREFAFQGHTLEELADNCVAQFSDLDQGPLDRLFFDGMLNLSVNQAPLRSKKVLVKKSGQLVCLEILSNARSNLSIALGSNSRYSVRGAIEVVGFHFTGDSKDDIFNQCLKHFADVVIPRMRSIPTNVIYEHFINEYTVSVNGSEAKMVYTPGVHWSRHTTCQKIIDQIQEERF